MRNADPAAMKAFGAATAEVYEELDWELIGRGYCEGDGSTFFDSDRRARMIHTAGWFMVELNKRLEAGGKSLYLGADVAELPLILAESLWMGRRIEWRNVECAQTTEIERALRVVSVKLGLELPLPHVRPLHDIEPHSCDHVWMVSVLTDPDAFPALHDELYERTGSPLATGRGSLADDRRRADELALLWLECARLPCVLSTTDEELCVIAPLIERRDWTLDLEPGGRLTSVVGDRVRIGTLRA